MSFVDESFTSRSFSESSEFDLSRQCSLTSFVIFWRFNMILTLDHCANSDFLRCAASLFSCAPVILNQ